MIRSGWLVVAVLVSAAAGLAAGLSAAEPQTKPALPEALLANPLVGGQPYLFVVRPQYRPDHHNTETMFQTGEINTGSFRGGGAMKVIDLAAAAR